MYLVHSHWTNPDNFSRCIKRRGTGPPLFRISIVKVDTLSETPRYLFAKQFAKLFTRLTLLGLQIKAIYTFLKSVVRIRSKVNNTGTFNCLNLN